MSSIGNVRGKIDAKAAEQGEVVDFDINDDGLSDKLQFESKESADTFNTLFDSVAQGDLPEKEFYAEVLPTIVAVELNPETKNLIFQGRDLNMTGRLGLWNPRHNPYTGTVVPGDGYEINDVTVQSISQDGFTFHFYDEEGHFEIRPNGRAPNTQLTFTDLTSVDIPNGGDTIIMANSTKHVEVGQTYGFYFYLEAGDSICNDLYVETPLQDIKRVYDGSSGTYQIMLGIMIEGKLQYFSPNMFEAIFDKSAVNPESCRRGVEMDSLPPLDESLEATKKMIENVLKRNKQVRQH